MEQYAVMELAKGALEVGLLVSAPMLGVALVIGLVIGLFQALTQINELTLTFVPKMVGMAAALAFFGPWMLGILMDYTVRLFDYLPQMVR